MPKIVNYKIEWNQAFPLLEREVNLSIAQGWQPVGGVTHTQYYMQAMVMYEDETK